MTREHAAWGAMAVVGVGALWLLFFALPRWYATDRPGGSPAVAAEAPRPAAAARTIHGTLFYLAGDGLSLVGVETELPYADRPAEQARRIIEAQLDQAPEPHVGAIPSGTRVRGVYVTARGEAFVDLTAEVSTNHPGGVLQELLTVYTIVNALTVNLPAVTAVQILIDGHEVDTLAGHVDLRHPLEKRLAATTPAAAQE